MIRPQHPWKRRGCKLKSRPKQTPEVALGATSDASRKIKVGSSIFVGEGPDAGLIGIGLDVAALLGTTRERVIAAMNWLVSGTATADLPRRIASTNDIAAMAGTSEDSAAAATDGLIAEGRLLRRGNTVHPIVTPADLARLKQVIDLMDGAYCRPDEDSDADIQ